MKHRRNPEEGWKDRLLDHLTRSGNIVVNVLSELEYDTQEGGTAMEYARLRKLKSIEEMLTRVYKLSKSL